MDGDKTGASSRLSGLDVGTTLGLLPVIALSATMVGPAMAQQTTLGGIPIVLNEVVVDGDGNGADTENTNDDNTEIGRLPGKVQDTPQVVNVINQEVIKQQQAQTLDQVLRNTPGVTIAIGEGGGGINGSGFRIRGQNAQTDVYVDGLRDFGVYTRDSFNMESVQVFKGPSSETFGMGTTGGAINSQSKTAKLENFVDVAGTGGNGPLGRATIDVNRQLSETSAIRFNGMFHMQDVADRDLIEADRWGAAVSAGFGIGTDLEFNLSFLHQQDDRVPDYGIPVFARTPGNPSLEEVGLPSTEFGVPRSNFYGFATDADKSQVDMLTGRLKWEANDWLTIYNDTRLSYADRYFATTQATCNAACIADFFDGNPATDPQVSRGGPAPYYQEGWAVQNVTTGVAKFDTGRFKHEFVAGLDMHTQHNERYGYSYDPARPGTSLLNPTHPSAVSARNGGFGKSDADNIGVFASDRVWVTEQLSILGGARWDWYSVDSINRNADNAATNPGLVTYPKSDSSLFNPKASIIWEPTENQTYYASWARSATPQGLGISTGSSGAAAGNDLIDPEENENFEVGAKVNFLDGKLGVTGAVFQTNKNNSKQIDPATGDVVASSGEKQRIRGVELGVAGLITSNWSVTGGYTYLDAEILEATGAVPDPLIAGNQIAYTPKHSFSLWTTYDATSLIEDRFGGKLVFGTGVNYRDKVYLNSGNTAIAPENISWDAMASYEKNNFRVALNVNNITDRLNYDQVWGNRVVPSSGRTFLLTVGAKF